MQYSYAVFFSSVMLISMFHLYVKQAIFFKASQMLPGSDRNQKRLWEVKGTVKKWILSNIAKFCLKLPRLMNICILIFFHMHNDLSILINRGLIYDLPPQCVTRLNSFLPISNPIKFQTNKTSKYVGWFFATLCRVAFDKDLNVYASQNPYLHIKMALVGLQGSIQLMDTTCSEITTKIGTDSAGRVTRVEGGQVPSEKTFKL